MLKILYAITVLLINILFFISFGAILKKVGASNIYSLYVRGAFSLIFFNTITYFSGLYFFKKTSEKFRRLLTLCFTILLIIITGSVVALYFYNF